MDCPFYIEGALRGSLTAERSGDGVRLLARCDDDARGIYRAAAVGTLGRLELGVLAPEGGRLSARRTVREPGALGVPLRGEGWLSYRFPAPEGGWRHEPRPAELFSDPLLRAAAEAVAGARVAQRGNRLLLAIPWSPARAFALAPVFCFARVRAVEGTICAVFTLDGAGRPVFG